MSSRRAARAAPAQRFCRARCSFFNRNSRRLRRTFFSLSLYSWRKIYVRAFSVKKKTKFSAMKESAGEEKSERGEGVIQSIKPPPSESTG